MNDSIGEMSSLQLRLTQLQQPTTLVGTSDGDGVQLRKNIEDLFSELLPGSSFKVTESRKLSGSIFVDSDWKAGASPVRLTTILTDFLPDEAGKSLREALPQKSDSTPDIVSALDRVSISNLRLELNTDPLSLASVDVGVELGLAWVIVKGRDGKSLVELDRLGLQFSAMRRYDHWELSPCLTGSMTLAGGQLSGFVDLNAKSFFCVLRDDVDGQTRNEVNLKQLMTEAFDLPEDTFPFKTFTLTRFEIWGYISGGSYGFNIGTTSTWDMPELGEQKVTIRDLFLKLEYDKSDGLTPALGGTLEIFGMTFSCAADYAATGGWTFAIKVLNVSLTKILASILGDKTTVSKLPEVTFPVLALTVTPSTSAFRFHGIVDIQWKNPLGTDGEFACNVDLKLERNASSNGTAQPVTCNLHIKGSGALRINGRELKASIELTAKTSGKAPLQLEVHGGLSVPLDDGAILSFGLHFETDANKKQITASWPDPKHKGSDNNAKLNFVKVASALGADISNVPAEIIPVLTGLTFAYDFSNSSLELMVKTETAELALMTSLIGEASKQHRVVAFGLKAAKISTSSMGPLGTALEPYKITLDNLLFVAANADAPKRQLRLGDGVAIEKGLVLKGTLKFEGTSYSFPFECNAGGKKATRELAAPAEEGADATVSKDAEEALEEGKNNVKVGRQIGPVLFRKVRFESREQPDGLRVYMLIDASLGKGGFDLDLEGFNVNFPIKLLANPKDALASIGVGLDGLSITYSNPPLTIAGGFSRVQAGDPYVGYLYTGHLLINAKTFQIGVFGSYGVIKVQDRQEASLFVYGMYSGVIGGPPPFFVTGLALGGGYNTRLVLPPIEEVSTYPLVQAVTDPAKFKSQSLRTMIQPSYGDYWLAIGVKFTSFKVADSFALVSLAFGNRLQFALLGLTKFVVPVGAPEEKCAVYAELAIRAVIDPEGGVFSIEGRLTSNSYVFSKEIRLIGGFAFYVWFGKAKEAGDFVITLGGYHPDFSAKPYYPVVPRIGVEGKLANVLTIRGGAYLALTPSCVMAGLQLEAVFECDLLTAAFLAYAHFLIGWAPFRYDAKIGIGLAVTLKFLRSFKLELSASLHIWGPPFAGRARITFWIISFSVEFGDVGAEEVKRLDWAEFRESFLPPRPNVPQHALLNTIRISEGLVSEVKKGEAVYRIVNAHELMIETDSTVPCSQVTIGALKAKPKGNRPIGIRPMGAKTLTSIHAVTIVAKGGTPVDAAFKPVRWSKKNFPEALWSPDKASGKPEARMIEDVLSGIVLRVQPIMPLRALGPFSVEKFKYTIIPKTIPWGMALSPPPVASGAFSDVSLSNPLRDRIRDSLRLAKDATGWNEIRMTNTHGKAAVFFQAPPTCAELGQRL